MLSHLSRAFSETQVLAGYLIFLGSYLVFAIGKFPGWKIDRPGAAIIGAVMMFAFCIGFWEYFRVGLPITVLTWLMGGIWPG